MEDENVDRRPEDLIRLEPLFPSISWQDFITDPPVILIKGRSLMTGSTLKELDSDKGKQEKSLGEYLGFTNLDEVVKKYRTDRDSGKLMELSLTAIFFCIYRVQPLYDNTVYFYQCIYNGTPNEEDRLKLKNFLNINSTNVRIYCMLFLRITDKYL
uniref:PF08974 domain protein n=1 Tax=Heterorhabditis bacteriophora TaxID=37862 RepID=A0A1I7XC87_HETBA